MPMLASVLFSAWPRKKKLSPLSNQKLRALFASSEEKLSCKEAASPLKANASSNTEASQNWQWSPQRRRLLLQTVRFMEEIQAAAEALEPHRLVSYLYNLAAFLSQFYGPQENRINPARSPIGRWAFGNFRGRRFLCWKRV